MGGFIQTITGALAGGALAALGVGAILLAVAAACIWYILQAVGYWKFFAKAGEAPWQALIPIYNTYVRYRLSWNTKMFWISAVLIVAGGLIPDSGSFVMSLVSLAVSIAGLVISAKSFHNLARSFGYGAGFAVGLFFLHPIFALILGMDSSEYRGNLSENA